MTELKEVTKEVKPKSFRIDDETHEKFKEISANIGAANQQETFTKLIEAYELQQGKLALKEEGVNVEQFEKYLKCLLRIYIANVEDKQHIRATVRTEFEEESKSKDKIIHNLQAQLEEAEKEKEQAIRKLTASKEEIERLNQCNIEQEKNHKIELNNLESDLKDKEELLNEYKTSNNLLTESKTSLKEQVEQMKTRIKKAEELEQELVNLKNIQNDYDKLMIDFNTLETNLKDVKAEHEKIIEQMKAHETEAVQRAGREAELKHKEALAEFKEKKQKEIDEYQKKYLALLERLEQMKNVPATEQQEKKK